MPSWTLDRSLARQRGCGLASSMAPRVKWSEKLGLTKGGVMLPGGDGLGKYGGWMATER
jgi:hypothetical protein